MLLVGQSTLESVAQFFTALMMFIFVVIITWFVTRYLADFQRQRTIGANIEVIETIRIAPNKYLQIVRAGEKYLLIAVCKDTVMMLSELSADALVMEHTGQNMQMDFGNLLELARKKLSAAKTEKEQADRDEE